MKGIYMPRQTYRTEKVVLENGLLMRGKILRYDDPTEPVAQDDWDVLK